MELVTFATRVCAKLEVQTMISMLENRHAVVRYVDTCQ